MELVKSNNNKGTSVKDIFPRFEKIEFLMDELINEIVHQTKDLPLEAAHKPLTIGFSIKINSQGQPSVEEINNMPANNNISTEKQVSYNAIEPMGEVSETNEELTITLEIPGMKNEEIFVKFFGESGIVIEAKNNEIAYFKEINLATQIQKESLQKKYTNNILEVNFLKKK
ncbi:MAG: Hsp20/alpha crystallin family protein [Candidatus Diapherotrites archaeon]|nr:Hsp20/alpha crystallin family protein [Candidatus Diapherotrites archaeon]